MKSEISRNILLIALAVRLQRLVKNLPNNHVSAERISRKSLAESYFSEGLSKSTEGARKKASRYMDVMEQTFGLDGSETSGYVMAKKFETFRDMFAFWLDSISPPSNDDKRLHIILTGLIHSIDNAFSEDPIVIPNLARQLKEKYGNKNIRDTKEPLNELFDNHYIASWLQLIEMDEGALAIDASMDPLLLRLKPRQLTGSNQDVSIKLARPGRIHIVFEAYLSDLERENFVKCQSIAKSVKLSYVFHFNKQDYVPYILYREGKAGDIMLTMWNLQDKCFEDINIKDIPEDITREKQYIPLQLDSTTWKSFQQLLA